MSEGCAVREMQIKRQSNKLQSDLLEIGSRSEKYYLICVLYTSLLVMAKSILFTDCGLYESQVEENLTFKSFE